MGGVPKQLPLIPPVPSAAACCAPLTAAPLSAAQADQLAVRLKAIADPTRLRLLSIMLAAPELEACTCDLTEPLGLTQPTVTHHLRKLADAGLVVPDRRVGNFTYYRVLSDALGDLAGVLSPATGS
ncbi:MAG TPA: metalloregulator ArsR/SmtB family transcription factor [Marmoricola sp.]|nr:metalloregulator ArsR/SmtB family transcription factor [Marmoricola sp.]